MGLGHFEHLGTTVVLCFAWLRTRNRRFQLDIPKNARVLLPWDWSKNQNPSWSKRQSLLVFMWAQFVNLQTRLNYYENVLFLQQEKNKKHQKTKHKNRYFENVQIFNTPLGEFNYRSEMMFETIHVPAGFMRDLTVLSFQWRLGWSVTLSAWALLMCLSVFPPWGWREMLRCS